MTAVLKINKSGQHSLRAHIAGLVGQGVSIGRIAIEAGVPRSALEKWLDGAPSPDDLEDKLATWLDELERAERADPVIVETTVSRKIEAALAYAQETPSIAVIYGEAGCGKTTAARRYAQAREYGHPGRVVYLAAGEFTKTPTAIANTIAEAAGGYGRAYRTDELAQWILQKLPPNSLVLVDEANHLSTPAIDGVRWLLDEGGIGLALLGNPRVYTRLMRGARADFAQLNSRVGRYVHIEPTAEDVDAVLGGWGVSGVAERALAQQIAKDPGGLRVLGQVLAAARQAARVLKRPLDAALMRSALEHRGGLE